MYYGAKSQLGIVEIIAGHRNKYRGRSNKPGASQAV
jgi:hypothetical protein